VGAGASIGVLMVVLALLVALVIVRVMDDKD